MSRDEIFSKVQEALVEALSVDAEDVKPGATLQGDLGAESIDFLDILFRLEKSFNIKLPRGELFPDNLLNNPEYVQNGKVTPAGLKELKARVPHADFSDFEKDPQISKVPDLFKVETLVKYIESKVG
jgi:acyl carrier protein